VIVSFNAATFAIQSCSGIFVCVFFFLNLSLIRGFIGKKKKKDQLCIAKYSPGYYMNVAFCYFLNKITFHNASVSNSYLEGNSQILKL